VLSQPTGVKMETIIGQLESVYIGSPGSEYGKQSCAFLQAELDGLVGDRHRGIERSAWSGDKQVQGTIRRNERQWSAVSMEELVLIEQEMDLGEALTAANLGANLCLKGVPKLSQLPKGTLLIFPSGAELMVEEYNPPCPEMSQQLASIYTSRSGAALGPTDFSKAAKFSRGFVGIVEVAGIVRAGDTVTVKPYRPVPWLSRLTAQQV
jgi:MOSC domain-containing protein YiiM